jgi:hypothetical protein
MQASRVLAGLAAAGVLCACGSSSSAPGGGGTSTSPPATSPSGGGTSTSSPATCPFTSDSVSPSGTVEIRPLGQAAHQITALATLPCYSFLQVTSGAANATFVTLSNSSMCQLSQNPGSNSLAVLWTREPVPADYLFRLAEGEVQCTFNQPRRIVSLCGVGTMSVQGAASATAQCSQDPTFQVTVHAGLVVVTYASGSMVLHSAQGLKFDSITNEVTPIPPAFITGATAVYTTQLRQMRLTPIPQAITFTSSAPKTVRTGDTYQVSAMGGASGNAVTLTIDSPGTSMCSISGTTAQFTSDGVISSATVTYTNAGPCTIDANQAGNALYQVAPQQQQVIQVVSPIS